MFNIDRENGSVRWGTFTIKPLGRLEEFESASGLRAEPAVQTTFRDIPPLLPPIRRLMEQLFPAEMTRLDTDYRDSAVRMSETRRVKLPTFAIGANTLHGSCSFESGKARQLEYGFTMTGDERGWVGYSTKNEQARLGLSVALLNAHLGEPTAQTSFFVEGLNFATVNYQLPWGHALATFDQRGGGVVNIIEYTAHS